MFAALAMKSPSAPGQVPDPGMKAKNRGWSTRLRNGSTSRSTVSRISSNDCGSSGGALPRRELISAGVARRKAGADASPSCATSASTVRYPIARIASGSTRSGSTAPPLAISRQILPGPPDPVLSLLRDALGFGDRIRVENECAHLGAAGSGAGERKPGRAGELTELALGSGQAAGRARTDHHEFRLHGTSGVGDGLDGGVRAEVGDPP